MLFWTDGGSDGDLQQKITKIASRLASDHIQKEKFYEFFLFRGQNHLQFQEFYAKIFPVECGTLRKKERWELFSALLIRFESR